uniref:SFRICE_004730 n=1 Tax=Spodoptera frugiperda TaxID=7108 RepID=A0A2H1WJA9_SPOFR
MDEKLSNIQDIDVNSPEFYDKVQAEIEFDTARMKKNVEVLMNLRLEAAEIEVETAALFHAEIWYDMLDKPDDDNDDDDDFSDGGDDESGEDQDMEEDASTTPIEEKK